MLLENDETVEIQDDDQIKAIEAITDEKELEAAKELVLEDIEKAEKGETEKTDNLSAGSETEQPKEFSVTQELIEKQPEENRAMLTSFLGKNKEDLAKAAANAIALKNPYLKDNQEAIDAIAVKLKAGTDEEIVKTFIETQRVVGKSETVETKAPEKPTKVELPDLEDTPEVRNVIQKETIKKLKEKYPGMPEDVNSVEHKEWLRDLQDEDLKKAIEYTQDIKSFENDVKTDYKKVVYLKNNWSKINNERLESEVKGIQENLKKLGLTDKDLGVDLTLTKNKDGLLENPILNDLAYNGDYADPYVIAYVGDLAFFRNDKDKSGRTPLVKKFFYEKNLDIISILNSRESINTKKEIERVRDTNLNTLHDQPAGGKSPGFLSPDEINNLTDEALLQREKEKIENSL